MVVEKYLNFSLALSYHKSIDLAKIYGRGNSPPVSHFDSMISSFHLIYLLMLNANILSSCDTSHADDP